MNLNVAPILGYTPRLRVRKNGRIDDLRIIFLSMKQLKKNRKTPCFLDFAKKGKIMRIKIVLLSLLAIFIMALNCQSKELILDTQDFAPYTYLENGQVSGPAASIIKQVCAEMNIKCELRLQSWTRAQYNVRNGKANGLFVLAKNKEREEWLYFSAPIFLAEYGIFVRENDTLKLTDISQLKGYMIGVYGPSNTSRQLELIHEKVPEMTIDMRPDDIAGFKKLYHGRNDAIFSNKDVGWMIVKNHKLKGIRYAGAYKKTLYYIGFSKKLIDEETVKSFNANYIKLYKNGTIKTILHTYDMSPLDLNESNF
jgi:polar amino acid transport system substrate-binding protein